VLIFGNRPRSFAVLPGGRPVRLYRRKSTWTFTSIDPATLDVPADPLAGFLPPDDSQGNGQGFVSYTIRPKAGSRTGTAINAQASVVFDSNAPLSTAPILNTLDVGVPSSSVTPLPLQSTSPFTVKWSGQDDSGGSGIASYDVYVSTDGGPFTRWLKATALTASDFTGQVGHAYAFYSVATDYVGNVQPTPTGAQATTTVANPAPPATTTTLSIVFKTSVANQPIALTATVGLSGGAAGAGVAGSVLFKDGSVVLATVPLQAGGVAKFTTAGLKLGNHAFTATFVPSNAVATSAGSFAQVVQATALEPDPSNSRLMALAVGTTSSNGSIEFVSQKGSKPVLVKVNGKTIGSFAPTGALPAYGGPTNSTIKVSKDLKQSAVLIGGTGTNIITAGGGPTVLVGGPGTDTLTGGAAPSILIGGKGRNTLAAGAGGSLLVGGQTSYDHNEKALLALLAEWKGSESIDAKIKHLQAGSHLAPGVPLNTKTALNAGAVDTLIGGKGVDWFLNLSSKDTLKAYDLKKDRFNVKPKR
jgi:Ca2+-binding RTX toxin-like protein